MSQSEKQKLYNLKSKDSNLDRYIEVARGYLHDGWKDVGDTVPSQASLACLCGISRSHLVLLAVHSKELREILDGLNSVQERELINQALAGKFNPAIAKMMMVRHGYYDKVESDVKSSDQSMSPHPIITISTEEAKQLITDLNNEC